MEVLRLHNEQYTITISTAENGLAWERFERRVGKEALRYCDYASAAVSKLSLCQPDANFVLQDAGEGLKEWKEKHPVLFETGEYQFAVEFHHSLTLSDNEKRNPHVRHSLRSIVESFKFYRSGDDCGFLVGTIDFLNSPGKFRFAFEYYNKDGQLCEQWLELYVASPKLDTKNDLQKITALINREYENYVFDYLTLTFSSYNLQRTERNNQIIWLSIFKSVVDLYFRNVRYVMSKPNNKPIRKTYVSRPERIRRWSQQEEERFKNLGADADKQYFRYILTENTTDTKENRFVKYSLHVLGNKFRQVFGQVRDLYSEMDSEEIEAFENYNRLFLACESAPFFRQVGAFEGFKQESAVLQQRTGYSQIYKAWLMLRNSLDLVEGKTEIGMKKIWELYEIWCFLIMKRLIAKTLSIDIDAELRKPDDQHPRIREDKSEMLVSLAQSDVNHIVEFDAPNGDIVRLEYQHTYNRSSSETRSVTTEQRPDIQITITKPDGFVLTYLYDAKYRVQDDKKSHEEDADIDVADFPLPDAINQMHRYRDAIYYSMKADKRPEAKEIIGGYILFPGRTFGDAIENRYFYKSIKQVNIGAFPLLPSEGTDSLIQCNLLEKHLQDILLNNTAYEQIKDSIPQKGLYYSEDEPRGKFLIASVSDVKSKLNLQLEAFVNGEADYYISGHTPSEEINILDIKYFAPVISQKVYGYYKVSRVQIVHVPDDKSPFRVKYTLCNYTPLDAPVTSGVWQMNPKGWVLDDNDFWENVSQGQLTYKNK